MLLLELAVQAVRGFSPSVRVALKPGFVVLKSPAEAPAPVAGLISALCFPDGRGQDAASVAPGQKAGKAGVTEEKKLEGLKAELAKARESGELQYRLDGLTSDAYRLESKQKVLDEKYAELEAARAELANAPTPERLGVPADIVERV